MVDTQLHQSFSELLKYRRSIRGYKPDPVPEEYIQMILDDAHYAMSGANSQPWEVIVVTDPEIRKKLFDAYYFYRQDTWYFEQQRIPRYRHPSFNVPGEDMEKSQRIGTGWGSAPVYLAVLQDPRKQYGSVLKTQGSFGPKKVLSCTMGHFGMVLQLAAASLGLGAARIDIVEQTKFREALGYPEPLFLEHIVPVGYRAYEPGPPRRRPLEEMIHNDTYDMQKYLRDEDFLAYLDKIRELGRPGYMAAIGEE